MSKIRGIQEHVPCTETWADHINNSVLNELTDVTPEEARAAVMKYRTLCDADYVEAFRIGEIPWLDTADREDIARMIVSDRRKAKVPALRAALKLLSVYREDHACTDEDCEECEIVLAAERALGGE